VCLSYIYVILYIMFISPTVFLREYLLETTIDDALIPLHLLFWSTLLALPLPPSLFHRQQQETSNSFANNYNNYPIIVIIHLFTYTYESIELLFPFINSVSQKKPLKLVLKE
jgi:hypothetical protein